MAGGDFPASRGRWYPATPRSGRQIPLRSQPGCCVVLDLALCMCQDTPSNLVAFHMSPDVCDMGCWPVWFLLFGRRGEALPRSDRGSLSGELAFSFPICRVPLAAP